MNRRSFRGRIVKTFRLKIIAVAVGCTFATGAMAVEMTTSEYETARAKITEERRAANQECEEASELSRADCLAKSEASEMVSMARLEAEYRPGTETEQAIAVAEIEAEHLVAIAGCDEGTATSNQDCVATADAARETALAAAGAESRFSDTGSSTGEPSVAGAFDDQSDQSSASWASDQSSDAGESGERHEPSTGIAADSETYFEFGKAELGQTERDTLDTFVDKLEENETGTILIVGYTDRIGPAEVNQQLARQRAENVKTYLLSRGIDTDRIRTEGRSTTDGALTASTGCADKRGDPLVACLQPDRRVQLQVTDRNISQR
jgi:outer membrane protein OmpA-like peptidoglycan-associated protein